jgi:hypothetical protein
MNASGFRSVGASCTGTKEVIFEANTGETEEIHRQRKFASAGHCNFDDIELQFRIFEYLARIERLWFLLTRCSKAPKEAIPTRTADRKYPRVKMEVRGVVVSTSKYAEGNMRADTISKILN